MTFGKFFKEHYHRQEIDKVNEAGQHMAHAVFGQISKGQISPFEVPLKNTIKHFPDEMFLLKCTKRAVDLLAVKMPGEELPLYDEHTTIQQNYESTDNQLVAIFARPSEV